MPTRTTTHLPWFALGSLLAVLLPGVCTAEEGSLDLRREVVDGRYLIQHWDLSDGLPQASITDMAQGPDGFLWLTTFGGLVRFDGREFLGFGGAPTEVGWNPRMIAVAEGADGSLWVGLQDGGVVRWRDGTFENLEQPPELRNATVWDLSEGPGGLLVAADGGTWLYNQGEWKRLRDPATDAFLPTSAVEWDASGRGWVGTPGGVAWLEDTPRLHAIPESALPSTATTLRADSYSGIWLAGRGYLAHAQDEEVWLLETSPGPLASELVVDGEGDLWAAGGATVRRLGPEADVRRALMQGTHPFPGDQWTVPSSVRSVFTDRERNLWVGTDGRGLWRFGRQAFERHGVEDGLAGPSVSVIAGDGAGTLWVSSGCAGLALFGEGGVNPPPPGIPANVCCYALLPLANGRLWMGYGDGVGLFAPGDDGYDEVWSVDAGDSIHAIVEATDGVIWVGTAGGGALRIEGESVSRVEAADGMGDSHVSAIGVQPDGSVWFGHRSGSTVERDGRFVTLSESDGHPPGAVRAFLTDSDGTVWIGTYGGGLARYRDGRFHRYTSRDGLFDDVVSVILDDGQGWLWLNGNRGVSRVRRADLDAFAEGSLSSIRSLSFPTGEGNGGAQPAGWRDADGGLWFPTIDGMVGFAPENIRINAAPPILHIESAQMDDTPLSLNETTSVPPGHGDLMVRYTAASLRRPDLILFEYRLIGHEEVWQAGSTRRTVRYTNVPPGKYALEVRAVNEDDVPSEQPARLSFVVRPHLYETVWFRLTVGLLLIALGVGLGLIRATQDRAHNRALQQEIERRRVAQAALRDQEEHYRRIVQAATDGFLLADEAGRWIDVNAAACRIFGRSRDELLRTPKSELCAGDVIDVAELPQDGREAQVAVVACLRKDGSTFDAQVLAARFHSAGGPRVLLTVTDISELMRAEADKRELQRRLANAQRLEALGRLAGGIAHDFNNTLTVVEGNADLLRLTLDPAPDSNIATFIEQILECSHRANRMIRQLLAFGRQQSLEPEVLDPGKMVRNLEAMFRRLVRDDVTIRIHVAPDAGFIHADLARAEQALANLLINAGDAMPDGGTITVSVTRVSPASVAADYPDLVLEGDHVRISVEDTGDGIPGEVRPRIFEPFFSTKPVGEGTGLGLASVHGFVTQSSGQMGVQSEEGQGTRFDIFMPSVVGTPEEPDSVASIDSLPQGVETILLCDDDSMVRDSVAGVLAAHGFEVLSAADGREALDLLNENADRISALVTDLVMPGINGSELAWAALSIKPGIRVLFVSGYPLDVELEEFDDSLHAVLSKPFSAATLLRELRELLDR